LLNRLVKHQAAVFAFSRVEAVPFTNKTAEQSFQAVKIKQKTAMRFRTEQEAKVYTRIQGVITAISKQRLNLFQTLLAGNLKNKIQLSYT
jgi:hypothetical protein